MAGLPLNVITSNNPVGTALKTQAQIVADTEVGIEVLGASCDLDALPSATSAAKVRVELVKLKTNTVAGTSSSLAITKVDPSDPETVQATAAQNFTAEPTWTTTTVLDSRVVAAQGSVNFAGVWRIKAGEAVAIRTFPLSGTGPSATCRIPFKE